MTEFTADFELQGNRKGRISATLDPSGVVTSISLLGADATLSEKEREEALVTVRALVNQVGPTLLAEAAALAPPQESIPDLEVPEFEPFPEEESPAD